MAEQTAPVGATRPLDDRPVTWTRMFLVLLGSRLRSQLAYRLSMLSDVLSQGALLVTEFLELWVILHHAPTLGGMTLAEVALVYVASNLAFSLADLVCGSLDGMDSWVREGKLETLLIRPTSLLTQMITQDLQLRRIGRVLVSAIAYPIFLVTLDIDWTWWKVLLAIIAPLGGFLIYSTFFLAAGGFLMVVVGARQAANAVTYGGKYAGSLPGGALFTPIRVFFTFVAPALIAGWLPMTIILGIDTPAWAPQWLGWLGLPVGVVAVAVGVLIWNRGIRHYTGAGG